MEEVPYYNWKIASQLKKGFWAKEYDHLDKLDIDELKKKYGKRFTELLTIISKHDPMGIAIVPDLIQVEYDLEVKTIIVQLDKTESLTDVHAMVHREFVRWFGSEDSDDDYFNSFEPLAKDIYEWKTNPDRDLFKEYVLEGNQCTNEMLDNPYFKEDVGHLLPWSFFILAKMLKPNNKYVQFMNIQFENLDETIFQNHKVQQGKNKEFQKETLLRIEKHLQDFSSEYLILDN